MFIRIDRWRNYRRFPRPPILIKRIFILKRFFFIYFYSYFFITNTFTKCLYTYTKLLPVEDIQIIPIILFINNFVYIDVVQTLGHFLYYYFILLLVYIACLLYSYIIFISSSIWKKWTQLKPTIVDFEGCLTPFLRNNLNPFPRIYWFCRHYFS